MKAGRRTADVALAALLGVIFAAAALATLRMPWQAAILPLMVSGLGAGLAAALLRSLIRRPELTPGAVLRTGDMAMFLWFLAAVGAVTLLGFQLGGFLFALTYFRWAAGFGWLATLGFAVPVPVTAWLAFRVLLGRIGFDGVLLGAMF